MQAMTETLPPITICPPGKRVGTVIRVVGASPIPLITQTALVSAVKARIAPPANGDRRSAQERVEAAESADAMSVARAQPHRKWADHPDDARLGFPLGRFCAQLWRNDPTFGNRMHSAGVHYAKDVRAVQVAKGFHVVGSEKENGGAPAGNGELTPEETASLRANIFGLERTLEKANELLRAVIPRCVRAMVHLCYDHDEHSIYDTDMLRQGLYRLSLHYGLWEKAPHGA